MRFSATSNSSDRYRPGGPDPAVSDLKAKFDAMAKLITERGGWVTSVPGHNWIDFETLPGNTLPGELEAAGYSIESDGQGQRILPHAITERFARRADGTLEPSDEGSTRAVAETRTHAGVHRVQRYTFRL